ncbi:AsmA family protein [Verticiella sediminum]|nr:AsmA family protein [Verticiella sediminum]
MKTAGKWLLGILATLIVLIAVAGVILYTYDWNRAKPRINALVSDATGRRFAIEGDLGVRWQRDALAPSGWRRYVPLPVIHAESLELGNPDWAEHENMAEVGRVSFGVELLPLLSRAVVLRNLNVDGARVAIERTDQANNWTFEKPAEDDEPAGEPWRVAVSEVRIEQGHLAYRDAPLALSLDAELASLDDAERAKNPSGGEPYGLGFTFEGKYRDAAIKGEGKSGAVLSLRDTAVRYPVMVEASAGKVEARAEGQIGNLYAQPEIDLDVRIAAPSMAMLYPLTGVVLPNTPPFSTDGHLSGTVDPERVLWRYADFHGKVGGSDLDGDLTYDGTGARPKLIGEMRSKLLRFEDLGPVVGVGGAPADPAAKEAEARKGQAKTNKRPGRVLPDDEFLTDRWRAMDLDLKYTGERIVRDPELPFQKLNTHAVMEDGVLSLQPLAFGVADGQVKADIRLDGREDPMRARLQGSVSAVQLPRLFPTVEAMQQSAGRIDGAVALTASGNSVAELLGGAGGEINVYLQSGRISKFLLEAASLNIASAVVAKLFGDSEVRIDCAGVSMALKDGLATMRDFRISTQDALIDITGAVDFKGEILALDIKPQSTSVRLVSLRTPLYVNGTFAKPDIGLEKGPLMLRAGIAAAVIAIAPPAAALLPLTVPGTREETDCNALLAHAREKPSLNPDTRAPVEPVSREGGGRSEATAPADAAPRAQPAEPQRGGRVGDLAVPEGASQAAPRQAPANGRAAPASGGGGGGGTPKSSLQVR